MLNHLMFWKSAMQKAPQSNLSARSQSRFEPINRAAILRLRQRAAQNLRRPAARTG